MPDQLHWQILNDEHMSMSQAEVIITDCAPLIVIEDFHPVHPLCYVCMGKQQDKALDSQLEKSRSEMSRRGATNNILSWTERPLHPNNPFALIMQPRNDPLGRWNFSPLMWRWFLWRHDSTFLMWLEGWWVDRDVIYVCSSAFS